MKYCEKKNYLIRNQVFVLFLISSDSIEKLFPKRTNEIV